MAAAAGARREAVAWEEEKRGEERENLKKLRKMGRSSTAAGGDPLGLDDVRIVRLWFPVSATPPVRRLIMGPSTVGDGRCASLGALSFRISPLIRLV